ncbi:MAG: CDP-alcohol phosphatidyltransferase family protein [bacterium]
MLEKYRRLQTSLLPPVFKFIIKPVELVFLPLIVRLPLHPHFWTLLSLLMNMLAVYWLLAGKSWGWLILWLFLSLMFDGFDGEVARWKNLSSYFGACADTFSDIIGSSLLISAVIYYALVYGETTGYFPMLALAVILAEILYQTVLVGRSLSGGILEDKIKLPAWDEWLLNHEILPFYFIDFLFFILSVGPLFFSFELTFAVLLFYQLLSLFYILYIQLSAARRHDRGGVIIKGFLKKLLLRTVGFSFLLFGCVNFGIYKYGWLLVVWLEFWIFYALIIKLLKMSMLIPASKSQRKQFISELHKKDLQFFRNWYP